MAMLTMIPCPRCKVRLQTPDKLLGKTIHCPKCKKPIKLRVRSNGPVPAPEAPQKEPVASQDDADFIAGLEQIDDVEAPKETPAESEAVVESDPDEVETLMENMVPEEAAEKPADEEEAVEEEAIEEEAVEEEPIEEEAIEEEAVEEDAVEEKPAKKGVTDKPAKKPVAKGKKEDDVEEEPAELSEDVENFMAANLFLIKGQSGIFSLNAAWDFLDPKSKKKIGTAVERPEGVMQALRFFMRRNWLPSKIEIREQTSNELVFVVKRPAYFFNCTLEVRDANNKLLAKFTYKPLSRLVGKPMQVDRKGGEKFGTCEFYFLKGRVDLMDDNKKELANMQTESAYTKAIKIYWAARGGSYYVTINKPLFDKPRDKMIFLGVTLAMDLLQEDSKASSGKGGISIGT
jgi:hypothetical protein